MKHILVLALLGLSHCAGEEFIRIDIGGDLDNWTGIEYYQSPPLDIPVQFAITLWVPTNALDQSIDSTHGVYLGPRLDFRFGPDFVYRESYPASKVEVYSGFGDEENLWGFRFSLPVPGEAYGLSRPADGIFSFYVTTGQALVLTDSLGEVRTHQGSLLFHPNTHADTNGVTPSGMQVQADADEMIGPFTATVVSDVPEINQSLLCALGVVTCIGLRRQRT